MTVETLPQVLALPTEQKEILAEELLNQVVLEKDKDQPWSNSFAAVWPSTGRLRRRHALGGVA